MSPVEERDALVLLRRLRDVLRTSSGEPRLAAVAPRDVWNPQCRMPDGRGIDLRPSVPVGLWQDINALLDKEDEGGA